MSTDPKTEESIFIGALETESSVQRATYLKTACGNDPELKRRVEALLRRHDEVQGMLDVPPPGLASAPDGPQTEETIGTLIGHYKLLELIGEGGFGDVYIAEQQEPVRRKLALKIIKLGMDTSDVIARFEAERQALALMDHPNIAKIHDAGATGLGRPYFVMELVHGIPLTEYCDQHNLTAKERLELFIDVCHAVQHAHQKGIIHRDLKPMNVLVTQQDGKPVPKIIDFGVAKATQQRLTEKTLFTEHRQLVGTPEYMSPEQATFGEADVDTRSDIYSLGVLLYELLIGTTPFDAGALRSRGYDEICRVVRESDPPTPSKRLSTLGDAVTEVSEHRHVQPVALRKLLRGDLDWIVMKALEKERTRRYETVQGLARDIERHLSDDPVRARPPTTGYRLKKFVRKHRGPVAAGVAVFAALTLGLIGTTVGFVRASGERETALRQRDVAAHERSEALQQRDRAMAIVAIARGQIDHLLHQAADYKIYLSDNGQEELTFRPRSLLDLDCDSDLGAGVGQVGSVFIWLRGDRPEVIGAIYRRLLGRGRYRRPTDSAEVNCHELHSLALTPLVADYRGERVWTPAQAGIELKTLPGVPPPATAMQSRLSQMCDFAEQFAASSESRSRQRWSTLTLKSQPLYRYGSPDTDLIDGALFAFLDSTDPELILLIEARETGSAARWHYALARLTWKPLEVRLLGKVVWEDPAPENMYLRNILESKKYQTRSFIDYTPAAIPRIHRGESLRELAIAYGKHIFSLWQSGQDDEADRFEAEAQKLWKQLESQFGHGLSVRLQHALTSSDHAELHRTAGRIDKAKEAATRAVELYEQLTFDFPDDHHFHRMLGYAHADLGHWKQAADAYGMAARMDPDPAASCRWYNKVALVQARAGDVDAYGQTCAKLLRRYGETEDPEIAAYVVDACLCARQAVNDPNHVADLAAAALDESGRLLHELQLAIAKYRTGRYKEASNRLERQLPRWTTRQREFYYPYTWLVLSMAQHQLGNEERAEKELNKAVDWVNQTRPNPAGEPVARIDRFKWGLRLRLNLLREEAEELLSEPNGNTKEE